MVAEPLQDTPAPAVSSRFREPWARLSRYLGRDRFFLFLAVVIGIVSGLAVVGFRKVIDRSQMLLLGPSPSSLRLFLVPSLVGVLVGFLVLHIFPRVRGSGVNQTKAALYVYDGFVPLRSAIGKFICCALAIGSGQSLGPEDPSLQIGASLASVTGRRLRLSRDKLRLLAPVGAAAGLAAAFNAPISAVLFVIEEVIGRWSAAILGAVVLSAISSVVVMRAFLGAEPLFRIPDVQFSHPAELLAYAALGVAGGLCSVLFARAIGFLRPRLKAMPRWTQYLQPGIAGLLIGMIGSAGFPQIMGAGYAAIDDAMHNHFAWKVLAILALLKILATTLSFVSGTPGGMFAPTLFVGAMLGGAVGGVERIFLPELTGSIGTYCLVGMGVLFAGFLRAPMTSVFMALEVSGNYSIIVPVIVANTVAYVISRSLQPTPIFDVLTRQDGLHLPSLEEEREERILRVEDAMRDFAGSVLEGSHTVAEAWQRARRSPEPALLVKMEPSGWCSVLKEQLEKMAGEGKGEMTLGSVTTTQRLPFLHPDQPLELALRHVYQLPLVPVVHRADFRRLLGVVSRDDVLSRYQLVSRDQPEL
jgi:CIC family chloride channel protein